MVQLYRALTRLWDSSAGCTRNVGDEFKLDRTSREIQQLIASGKIERVTRKETEDVPISSIGIDGENRG